MRRKEKNLYTENGPGEPVRLVTYATQREEAEDIAAQIAGQIRQGRRRAGDFAVFYRTNALSRALEFALRDQAVPYQMVNGLEFLQRKEIKDVLAYLRLLNNPYDETALLRVINTPPRGIGKTTIDRLAAHATRHGMPLLDAARQVGRVAAINARSAKLVTGSSPLFDRLAAVADSQIEELLGHVLTETAYEEQWRLRRPGRRRTAGQHRGVADRRPGVRRTPRRHGQPRSVPGGNGAGERHGRLGDRVGPRHANDAARLEGAGISGRLHRGRRGRAAAPRAEPSGTDQVEEERRLFFVGITRAQQELQVSTAENRDFRGVRKLTVPSSFLMELPLGEMFVQTRPGGEPLPPHRAEEPVVEPVYEEPVFRCERPAATIGTMPAMGLKTAAELANGGQPLPPPSPDIFQHGMLVRHPEYGLGRIVALSGSGHGRKATVDFSSSAGRKKFILYASPLRPVKA